MKRIALSLCAICITAYAFAQTETINWYVDGQTYSTSTCETGNDINLPPTPPEKLGYTFIGWGEYIPLEYIETTESPINTDFKLNKYSRFEYDIKRTNNSTLKIGDPNVQIILDTKLKLKNNKHTYSPCNMPVDTQKHTFIFDAYNDRVGIDDCFISMNGDMEDYDGTYQMPIAGQFLSNGWQLFYRYAARNYGLRFYEYDVLVRDFVPALDKNGTPCMYEKIEKKFYYKQSGDTLIAGPIIDE